MKRINFSIPIVLVTMLILSQLTVAQVTDATSARTVAENWITSVINFKGHWGDAEKASVVSVSEFKRGDRVLGYFCKVEPSGHIIVSLVEGLSAIKAFSETSELDPTLDEGPADLFKSKMEQTLNIIESRLGPLDKLTFTDLEKIPELDRRTTWDQLKSGPIRTGKKYDPDKSGGNYQEGEILIKAGWHQAAPYDDQCPVPSPTSGCLDPHCRVGCVALAGAMIMRYWSWPPGRGWLSMPNAMLVDPTPDEIHHVSHLCHDIGVAVGMDYCSNGCASSVDTYEMEGVYQSWWYTAAAGPWWRSDYSLSGWWNKITGDINANRPVHYRILNHSIVCDGWWINPEQMLHFNYGWANNYTAWYTVDHLYQPAEGGSPDDEYIVNQIVPFSSLGGQVSGSIIHDPSWDPRYIGSDCMADSVDFMAGQMIQFHQNKVMTCRSGWLNFYGWPGQETRLFTGEPSRGIVINSGYILMYPGAQIKFALQRNDW